MLSLLRTDLGRFRLVSLIEGLSYLALVFFAMPMKYGYGDPSWVRLIGRIHGGLFVLFVVALYQVALERDWSARKGGELFGLSLIPFGALVIEKRASAEAASPEADSSA